MEDKWHRLTANNVKRHVTTGKLFLGVAGDRTYSGRVDEVTDRYIALRNGADIQYVYHDQRMIRFQAFTPPEGFDFKMGDRELPL